MMLINEIHVFEVRIKAKLEVSDRPVSMAYGLTIDPRDDQFPVDLRAQLVEHCTGITEVRVRVPFRGPFLGNPATFRAYFG